MSLSMFLIVAAIGILTGIMAGIFGIGGGLIVIPALVFIMGFSQQMAQGTSLAMMLPPIGLIAAFNYYKAGYVNIKFALILAATFMVGSFFGSKIAVNISQDLLKKMFGLLLLAVAIKMLLSR
jgi:uncharacterized membrane protein YfcA